MAAHTQPRSTWRPNAPRIAIAHVVAETYTAHFTAIPAVQFNEVYLTPCTAVPSFSALSASDKRYSLGATSTIAHMALTQIELQRCKKSLVQFLEQRRPPEHIRDQLDIGYRIDGQSVEIFEIRPDWQDKSKKMETPVAKATFVRTKNRWKVFWMRRDLKWHGYEPNPEVHSLEAFLNVVHRDEYCCFFG